MEILTSIGVLALLMGSSVGVMVAARQYSEESRGRLHAMDAARTVLEVVKETPLSQVGSLTLSSYVPAGLKNGSIAITTSSATGNLSVDAIATVTATVTWTGPRNATRTFALTTMKSKYQ